MRKVQSGVESAKAPVFAIPMPVLISYEHLNPVLYNPRSITPRKYEALKEGIRLNGFLQALVVQKSTMAILGGNQRYKAVREICVEAGAEIPDLPCVIIDVDDRKARKINIALNNVGGDWDERLLGELLSDVHHAAPIEEFDALTMGFDSMAEIGKLIGGDEGDVLRKLTEGVGETFAGGGDGTGPLSGTKAPSLSLVFLDKEMRDLVKSAIGAKAKKDEPSGVTLARMLGLRAKKSAV
jgi:hypothetical protein